MPRRQVGLLSRACGPSREAPRVAALALDPQNQCLRVLGKHMHVLIQLVPRLLALGLGFHRFSALSWETLPFEANGTGT